MKALTSSWQEFDLSKMREIIMEGQEVTIQNKPQTPLQKRYHINNTHEDRLLEVADRLKERMLMFGKIRVPQSYVKSSAAVVAGSASKARDNNYYDQNDSFIDDSLEAASNQPKMVLPDTHYADFQMIEGDLEDMKTSHQYQDRLILNQKLRDESASGMEIENLTESMIQLEISTIQHPEPIVIYDPENQSQEPPPKKKVKENEKIILQGTNESHATERVQEVHEADNVQEDSLILVNPRGKSDIVVQID